MSRYVRAFASLSWQSGQSTSALNIESLENHLQFPIDPFDVQLHKCLQNEQWKRRYLRTWDFQNYHHNFITFILKPSQAPLPSSPNLFFSFPAFLVQDSGAGVAGAPMSLIQRWRRTAALGTFGARSCGTGGVLCCQQQGTTPAVAGATGSEGRHGATAVWARKRERRTASRIEIDGIRFQI